MFQRCVRPLPLVLWLVLPSCILVLDDDPWHEHDRHRHDDEPIVRRVTVGNAHATQGRVLDASGGPVRAHVSAVREGGSFGTATGVDGRFSFDFAERRLDGYLLYATTDDGWVGIYPDAGGVADARLVLQERGAVVRLRLEGTDEDLRCALFHEGRRIDDFTLRPGEESRRVVPSGLVPVLLYDGESVLGSRELRLAPGDEGELLFDLE